MKLMKKIKFFLECCQILIDCLKGIKELVWGDSEDDDKEVKEDVESCRCADRHRGACYEK